MKQIKLPIVPIPTGDPNKDVKALTEWATRTKFNIEQASSMNDSPLQQNLVLGSYTLTTAISGTSTGTSISNFLCTFINAMIQKGAITSINYPKN